MGGKSSSQTIGFWYYMDVLATLCHSPTNNPVSEIVEIQFAERTAWQGSITSSRTLGLYQKELFGGEKREGGVEGQIDVMMGAPTMSVNEYLGASLRKSGVTGPVPAYRGVCSLFFRGETVTNSEFPDSVEFSREGPEPKPPPEKMLFGIVMPRFPLPAFRWVAVNPYFKKFRVRARRYMQSWYPTKARIGNDANPAHIIYECFTDPDWGMGYPPGVLSDTLMRAVADKLYDEGFGLSISWAQQSSIEDFIKLILTHINGVVRQDRSTGELYVKLVRDDYDTGTLFQLDPTNCTLESYSRVGIGDTVNEVTLSYTKRDGKVDSVTVQDVANVTSQGRVVSQNIELLGIRDADLALKVAQRELNSRVVPISKVSLVANRTAFQVGVGDVVKVVWPDLGIQALYCRVIEVDLGRLEDNLISIEAIEDVFALPDASYAASQPGGWVNPLVPPSASTVRYITEVPYYNLSREIPPAEFEQIDDSDSFIDVLSKAPSNNSYSYNLWSAVGAANVTFRDTGSHTPTAQLTAPLVQEEFSVLQINTFAELGGFDITDNSMVVVNGEYMRIDSYDIDVQTVTVARGVLDTVPKTHAAGSTVFFVTLGSGRDGISYLNGDSVKVKVQTKNGLGEMPIASVPQDTYVITSRQGRPYAPGKLRINGLTYPSTINGLMTVEWATRNRLTQTANIVAQDFGNITTETNAQSKLVVKGENGTTIVNSLGAGSPYPVTLDQEYTSGVTAYSPLRDLRIVGMAVSSSPVEPQIRYTTSMVGSTVIVNYLNCERVAGGWLVPNTNTVVNWRARFVDGTTGAIQERTAATPLLQFTKAQLFTPKSGVYLANYYPQPNGYVGPGDYDPFVGYALLRNASAEAGLVWGETEGSIGYIVRDRRGNALSVMHIAVYIKSAEYQAYNFDARRVLRRYVLRANNLLTSSVTAGHMALSSQSLQSFYTGQMSQFDSATTQHNVFFPPYPNRTSIVQTLDGFDPDSYRRLSVIFGSLMYVHFPSVVDSQNTAGRAVDITNILTSHIDIATSTTETTYVYSIDMSGALTFVASRSGLVLADHVNATTGVEITNGTIRTVNSSTGALGSTIATLPASSEAVRVAGDPSSETFYVLADNYFVYRYNLSGTLLTQIELPRRYVPTLPEWMVAGFEAGSEVMMEVSAGYLYVMPTVNYQAQGAVTYRIEKNLSSYSELRFKGIDQYVNPVTVTARFRHDSPEFYVGRLMDENGGSSTASTTARPRLNDELSVELSSVRAGTDSHQKHEVAVIRKGWGMRWGRSWGGGN